MSNFCPAGWWLFRNDYHVCGGGIVRGFGSSAEYFIGVVSFSAHCSLPLSNPSYLTTALVLAPRWSSLTHSVSLVWFLIKREHCFGINIFRCSQGPDTVHYKWATINYSSQSDTVPGVPGVVIPRGSIQGPHVEPDDAWNFSWRPQPEICELNFRCWLVMFVFSHCNFSPLLRLKPSDRVPDCCGLFPSGWSDSGAARRHHLHRFITAAPSMSQRRVFLFSPILWCGFKFWNSTCPTGGKFLTWLEEDKQSNKTHSHDTD